MNPILQLWSDGKEMIGRGPCDTGEVAPSSDQRPMAPNRPVKHTQATNTADLQVFRQGGTDSDRKRATTSSDKPLRCNCSTRGSRGTASHACPDKSNRPSGYFTSLNG